MKKYKNGFTLSEILITLGIIGVVAAMTVPSMINDSLNRTIAPSLAKTVHDIENSLQNIIQASSDMVEESQTDTNANLNLSPGLGASTLDMIKFKDVVPNGENKYIVVSANMFDTLRSVTEVITPENTEYSYLNNAKIYNADTLIRSVSSNKYGFVNGNAATVAYRFPKSKAIFIFEPTTTNRLSSYANSHNGYIGEDVVIARIAIDSNGSDGPNRLGKDIFIFGVANNGKLVPAGSEAYNNNIFSNTLKEDLYTKNNGGCSGETVKGNGASCAARVVVDGWKINYK